MITSTAPTTGTVPAQLVLAVHDLFEQHHAQALLPALLAVVQPHLTDTPAAAPTWLDAAMQRRITLLLDHHRQPHLLLPVLDIVGPYLAQPVVDAAPAASAPGGQTELTGRELEVLVAMSIGRPNSAIGRQIGLTEDGVKSVASRLFRKLGAHDRAHAVARGFTRGYLQAGRGEVAA